MGFVNVVVQDQKSSTKRNVQVNTEWRYSKLIQMVKIWFEIADGYEPVLIFNAKAINLEDTNVQISTLGVGENSHIYLVGRVVGGRYS